MTAASVPLAAEGIVSMPATLPAVVVVDDEPDVLHSVHDLLRRSYRVSTFPRASEALAALEELDPAVIMSDAQMPEVGGIDFLRDARRIRPDATRLLFTGYSDAATIVDAINEGNVFRYIHKPWEPEELAAIVRLAVEHHELVTERRRLYEEQALANRRLCEADALKRRFIEVASHELNTPVAVVLGMTELLRTVPPETTVAELADWIKRTEGAGRRLAGIVERIVKQLQAEQFAHTLCVRPAELAPLIHRAAAGVEPYLSARRQTLELELHEDLGSAEIDAEKISDILTNLLINAIKFTPDGDAIGLSAGPHGENAVRLIVRDRGVGVSEHDRPHLFEPFFTGGDPTHHSSGDFQFLKRGMGLGLSLVKAFVTLHGGSVTAYPDPERGTLFEVVLPRRPPAPDRAAG